MNERIIQQKRMVFAILLVLLLSVVGMTQTYADVTIGNLNYSLDSYSMTATVTGHKDGTSATGNLIIPSSVTYGGQTYSVTSIDNYAFRDCSGLTGSLNIPSSVTSIGYNVFRNCTGFTGSLTIPSSVTSIGFGAFYNCSGFTGSLTIGNSVTMIDNYAFYGCSGFTGSLTIPSSVISIGFGAFYNCSGFTGSLTIGNSVATIGGSAFYGCSGFTGNLTIPNSVTTIGGYAFKDCSGFTGTLILGNSVTTIGNWAFGFCSGFTGSLTIPNSVTTIGDDAFCNCSGFTGSLTIPNSITYLSGFCGCSGFTGSLTIPNSVTTIGNNAFSFCSGFTGGLTIPNSVTTIGEQAFSQCYGFTGDLTIPSSVTTIGDGAFGLCGFTGDLTIPNSVIMIGSAAFSGCSGFTGNLTIGNSVTTIGSSAFSGCSGFTDNLTIPNSVTSIGHYAFQGCSGFTGDLTIPSSVTTINDYVFQGCSGFVGDLTIPSSVTTIGNRAFSGCSGFTGDLTIPSSVTTIGEYAFYGCSGFTGNLNIGNSVTTIDQYAFSGCSGFTGSLTIGNFVTTIGQAAFENCSGISSVYYTGDIAQWCNISFGSMLSNPLYYAHYLYINNNLLIDLIIPETVTEIKNYSFCGCSGSTGSLIIPNSVTSIGIGAFCACSGFTGNLVIPNSLTEINDAAFEGCSGFTGSLNIPSTVTSIGFSAFCECSGLTGNLTIPNSVTTIGHQAFSGCTGFTGSLTIPNSVTTIGQAAFQQCWFTGGLVIPNSITRIESLTFNLCVSFTSLEIPESITYIGIWGFGCLFGLQSITVLADNPPVLGNLAFKNVNKSIPVYVPVGTVAAYQAAPGWNEFTNYHEIETTSYTITASANPAEGGSVIGGGSYTQGTTCTLTATVNEGYSFVNWTENNEVVSTNANYSFTVSGNRNLVANFALSGTITNHWTPESANYSEIMAMYSVIQIDGVEQYSNMLEVGVFCGDECRGSAIASEFYLTHRYLAILDVFGENGHQLTFKLYDHSIGQELNLTSPATVTFDVNGYGNPVEPYVLNFTSTITHSQALNSGWNWWSTYVEQSGIDGLGMLENSIGSAGVRIQGRNGTIDQFEYQGSSYWYGSLTSIENEQMYKIRTNAACNAVMVGNMVLPTNHPITINGGWNWIGFPCSQSVSVNDAMSGFTPVANDVIKGRNGSTTYVSYGSTSLWYGTLNTLEPGQGYMYKSNSSTSKTLIFQTGRGEETVTNVTEENSFFTPNTDDFSDNMLVTAVINMDGQELRSGDYEVAAYVGNECRGSVRLMYVEPFDRYVAFLLVFGEAEEEIHFVLTDGNDVSWSDDLLTYTTDGMEGTLTEPYTLHFGTLGLNDNEHDFVNIFPNPSNGVFNIEGNGIHKIEVVNAFGQTILLREVENNLMQIDLSDKAAGVFLLRAITNNGITTKQLIKE